MPAIVAALACLSSGGALAGDVTIGSGDTFAVAVYGNSVAGDPSTRDVASPATSNTLRIGGGMSQLDAYGGYADVLTNPSYVDAHSNIVEMTGGRIEGRVIGGYSDVGATSLNAVTINGGAVVDGHVYGALNEFGSAAITGGNSVEIGGNAVISGVVYGAQTLHGLATGNTVSVGENSRVNWQVIGGDSGTGTATFNSVEIGGAVIVGGGGVTGGHADLAAQDNSVTVTGGFVTGLLVGARSEAGTATGNSVSVSGGTVTNAIFGGIGKLAVTGNTVEISGGSIAGMLIVGGATNAASATHNMVTIGPGVSLPANMMLHGGYCAGICSGDLFTGNTLNLQTAGLTIDTLKNFQYLNFFLPTTLSAGQTMLTVTGIADLTDGNGASSLVNVGINGASSPLATGDSITLIHAPGTFTTAAGLNGTATGAGLQGVTLGYVFGISATATDLIATVQSMTVTDESKALSEGVASGATLVNQGADLAAGPGMANAIATAGVGWSPFSAVSGGSIRANTGSHVDVNGVSLVAGLSSRADLSVGKLTAGAFAEYGGGSYDTFNSFASRDVRGGGDSHYVGAGLLGHQDFRAMGPGHAYAEGSVRVGIADNSFSSADLTSGGVAASYDTHAPYYGASAAVGYVWTPVEAMTIDVSGAYIWSRLGADSTVLTTGETVDFEAVDSQRTRLGLRVAYALSDQVTPYAGAAWEHEFDGEARASTNGLSLDAPSLAGDTGILEAGLTLKPSADLPLSVDLGVQGFVGQREGLSGSLKATLAF